MTRTQEEAHLANNAVIAIAKKAAERFGVELFLAVASRHDGSETAMVCGCDANVSSPVLLVQLAAFGFGAAMAVDDGLEREERTQLVAGCTEYGLANAKLFWDRDAIGPTEPTEEAIARGVVLEGGT